MFRYIRLFLGCVILTGTSNAVPAEFSAWENALVAKYREGCSRKDTARQSLPADYDAAAKADEIYLREKGRLHGGEILSRGVLLEDPLVNVRVLESQTDAGAKVRLATWQAAWAEGPLFAEYVGLPALPDADFHAATNLVRQVLLPTHGWLVKGLDRRVDSSFVVRGRFSGRVFDNPYAEEAWFFMIDDRPFANWSHPSRFAFVAKDLSSCVVLYADEPETVFSGTEKVRLPELMRLVDSGRGSAPISRIKSFLSNAFASDNAISYGGDASHSYAVIISGGGDIEQNYSRYWGDVAMVYSTLRRKYAMPKENIRVCVSDGKSNEDDMCVAIGDGGWGDAGYYNSPHDLDGDGVDDVGYDSRKSTIKSVFSSLANSLTSEDRLFVFITDHGTQNKSNGTCYLVPWITDSYSTESQFYALMISASEFAEMVQGIKCPISFAFEFCYSGGFIQPLMAQQNRVVATACGVEVSSAFIWRDPRNEDYGESWPCAAFDCCNPWAWAFNSAIRGCDSVWSEPWSDDSASQVGNADSDGDGLVSMYEAGILAKNWVLNTTQRSPDTGATLTFCDTPDYGESAENLGKALFVLKQSKPLPIDVPAIPSAPTVRVSGSTLSWNAVSGANYYKVYRSTNPYAEPEALSGWQTACSYTCSAPSSYGSYFYFVKASSTGEDATASAFSTQDAHLSYGSYAEVHKYGSSSFNVTPVSSDSTPLFNMTFYKLSGSSTAISGSFNGTTIGNGYPTVGSSGSSQLIIARNTFTVSGSSNTSSTPRFWGFYTTFANPPAGSWSSTGGKSYAEVVWLAHPHYYYQSGVASFSTGATSQSAGKDGGAYSVSVTATPSTTSWSASTSADWITLYRTSSSGSGALGYAVAANDTSSPRTGTITISGASTTKTLTVTQAAGEAPATLSSISISGSTSVTSGEQTTFTCKASYSDGSSKTVSPSWSVYSGSSYASINSSGVLTAYTVSSPQSVKIRATYGGISQDKTVTVNPKAVEPGTPGSVNASDGAYSDRVSISWTAASGATSYSIYRSKTSTRPSSAKWTSVTSPHSDTTATPGETYYYWVAAVNSAGLTVSSYNAGYRAASLSLGKSSDSFATAGGNGSASVTANTSWSATEDVSWISLGAGSGSGNGTLSYTVDENTAIYSRTGTITVTAGPGTSHPVSRTIVVAQEGRPEFEISSFGTLTKYNGPGGAVVIPSGVKRIDDFVFSGCSSMTAVTIPEGVTRIGENAFSGCSGLKSVTIPSSVENIESHAFGGCSGLKSVVFNEGVECIAAEAFWGCGGLKSVTLPASVTCFSSFPGYGPSPFVGCGGLTAIAVADDNVEYSSLDGVLYDKARSRLVQCPAGKIGTLAIPPGVTHVERYALWGCVGLTSVAIPSSMTSISDRAFGSCSGLTAIDVEAGNEVYASVDGILYNMAEAELTCCPCAKCGAVMVLDGVTSIGQFAFGGCVGLTSVTIPNGATSIGEDAFSGCSGLTSISIPPSLTSFGDGAFSGCGGLTTVYVFPGDAVRLAAGQWFGKSVTLVELAAPSAPTGVTASDGTHADKVLVSWTASVEATSYSLYRSTTPSCPGSPIVTDVTSPYSDKTTEPGVTYYYWVSASNWVGSTVSSLDAGHCAVVLSLDKSTASFSSRGGSGNASVTANTSWIASADADWIAFGPNSGNGVLSYVVAKSLSTASRTGTITVTAGPDTSHPVSKAIKVFQEGALPILVKFKGNGGTVSPTSVNYVLGAALGDCPIPHLDGSNFLGWYTAADGGVQVSPDTIVDGSFSKLYAHWASRKGSNAESAKSLTVEATEKSRAFALTQGFDEESQTACGYGVYWHKVTLEKGKSYTFWLTDVRGACKVMAEPDWSSPELPRAYFVTDVIKGNHYALMDARWWDDGDPDSAVYYVIAEGEVGDSAVLHYAEGNHLPLGCWMNPKVVNGTKIDNARTFVDGMYWFSVWFDAGEDYSISVRDDGTNGLKLDCEEEEGLSVVRHSDTALELRSDTSRYVMVCAIGKKDKEFLFTSTKAFYWLTFDSAGGSAVDPIRRGCGSTMDGLPQPERAGYRFVRWRFAADNAKVKATTLMPAADTALVAQWTELGRPSFVSATPKVYEDAGYAEIPVVRTSGEGAVSVRYATSGLTAFAGVDYVATEGVLSWSQGDMEAKMIRVKLIPELVGRYEASKKFLLSLSPLSKEEAEARGEYVAVLGEETLATVKIKNIDAQRVGSVTYVGGPLAVTAGEWLRVRVARTSGDDGRIAVKVKTQPGTALADADYVHVNETLVWEDGEDGERELWVRTLDAKSSETKTFNVKLSAQTVDAYADCALPEIPVTKSYVTLNGTAEPPPAVKASFTVTGPGIFTASPYVAAGTGRIKWKAADGWTVIGSSGTVNVKVPAGETTVQFKVIEASPDARLAFKPQVKGKDYRFVPMFNPGCIDIEDDEIVDSKGREVTFETYELTQGVYYVKQIYNPPWFAYWPVPDPGDSSMTLVGGSLPAGLSYTPGRESLSEEMGGTYIRWDYSHISGVPTKAKDAVAVFRIMEGGRSGEIVFMTFKVKAADLDFGNYYGVLRTEGPVSDFARLGWLKYSVAADGTVSAKATIAGVKHKLADTSFEVGKSSRVPEVQGSGSTASFEIADGRATVRVFGGMTYSCELHRAESDLADFAGYYTLALVPADGGCGNGYLTLTVGADGSVVAAGKFPDGTDFTASSIAYRAGDELEVPIFAAVAPWSFGGVLRIRSDRTVELGKTYNASVFDSSAALDWHGSPFGYGSALRLVPAGGYYNTVFNLQTYYLNRDFSIDAEGAPETALELVGNAFGPNATNTKLTFARETGIVSGKFDNWQTGTRVRYYGVVPMYRDGASPLSASVWATGFYLLPQPDGSVGSRPFAITAE